MSLGTVAELAFGGKQVAGAWSASSGGEARVRGCRRLGWSSGHSRKVRSRGDESAGDFGQAAVGVRVAVLLADDLSGGAVKVAARGKPFAPRGGHVRSPGFVHIPEDETHPSAGPVEDLAFDTSKVVDGGDVASVVEEYPDVLQDSGHRGCIS